MYKPDFHIEDFTINEEVYLEMKGLETATWRIKRRLWKAGYGPGRLRVYKKSKTGVYLYEEIKP